MKGSDLELLECIYFLSIDSRYPSPLKELAERIRRGVKWGMDEQLIARELLARGYFTDISEVGADVVHRLMFREDAYAEFAIRVLLHAGAQPNEAIFEKLMHTKRFALLGPMIAAQKGEEWKAWCVTSACSSNVDIEVFQSLKMFGAFTCAIQDDAMSSSVCLKCESGNSERGICLLPQLQFLVAEGGNVHVDQRVYHPLLHRACGHGCVKTVRYLLEQHRMDIGAQDVNGFTPLFCAMSADVVKCCLEFGADIRYIGRGYSVLHRHMWRLEPDTRFDVPGSFISLIEVLIDSGADLHYKEVNGDTPLGMAMRGLPNATFCEDLCKLFVEHGASPFFTTTDAPELDFLSEDINWQEQLSIVIKLHVDSTKRYCTKELLKLQGGRGDASLETKIDTSSDFGDIRLPRSVPYHRLPEWFAALRALSGDVKLHEWLRKQEITWLPIFAAQIEATPAAARLRERMAEQDCAKYSAKRQKK
jgi:hypothetical protein